MRKIVSTTLFCITLTAAAWAQETVPARIVLTEKTLMHEMRATPSPLDGAVVSDRAVSFQWPLPGGVNTEEDILDGVKSAKPKINKARLRYQVRYSRDARMKEGVKTVKTKWPFFNPENDLEPGKWYWQYGYVEEGSTEWSKLLTFTVEANPDKFCPPSLKVALAGLPESHPRVLVTQADWDSFRGKAVKKEEGKWYIERADKVLRTPMQSVTDIKAHLADGLDSEMKRNAMLTRESRRVIDKEEQNVDLLIRAYLLTKDKKYSDEAIRRIMTMVEWDKHKTVMGDFNAATMLSLCSMAYDSFYDLLTDEQKRELLAQVRERGKEFYNNFNNRLENHIADNHVWQMTLRIFTFAAFAVYGDLSEADTWVDYCYNVWLARFPGLNKDGAWHNGDSYFSVNARTLIEVPYFYSRLTGFDFFSDPWYQGNIMYTMFQQPPFSKSGGNGSGHQGTLKPKPQRITYLDALARLTGNTYAADYVRRVLAKEPNSYQRALSIKAGSTAWLRLQCDKPLPEGPGLTELPDGYVFPQTGVASFITNWNNTRNSAMISFRSSPYGSTSHALANQNAFNTFYGGSSLFYSSGHHISFTDEHSVYCHRGTRAHNTILVNGMGQRIGTEGYGWIPRFYVGGKIGYVLGDASNAYGKVISPLWLERGKASGLEYTPENGWDENHLKTFRRHIVTLGRTGLVAIYDELEADEPVTWDYLLHTVINPMQVDRTKDAVHVRATNKTGASDAYLFATGELKTDTTSKFFVQPVNWLRADAKGKFSKYPDHWHFKASSVKKCKTFRFLTLIHTHALNKEVMAPEVQKDGSIRIGKWTVKANLSDQGKPSLKVYSEDNKAVLDYAGEETRIKDGGKKVELKDEFPELEI